MRSRARENTEVELDTELLSSVIDAPEALEQEMRDLLRFKTSTLTAFGFQRNGVWNEEMASQKVEHLGLLFGALAASPRTAVRGFGAGLDNLCFTMLVFPAEWDWYLQLPTNASTAPERPPSTRRKVQRRSERCRKRHTHSSTP